MKLIIGGAYQGKLAYALQETGLGEQEVYVCTEDIEIPNGKPIIYKLEQWILALSRADMDVMSQTRLLLLSNPQATMICTEIASGIVPMGVDMRKWREELGRSLTFLAEEAEAVTRLFCGIPTRIK